MFTTKTYTHLFQIKIGCSSTFSYDTLVRFEFSLDFGISWHLYEKRRYPGSSNPQPYSEGSIFYSGKNDTWDRATFIVDPHNIIQHVSVNNLNVGRNPKETLRILDALQTDELCPCNRPVGGDTI